jgi:hypothetical protein
MNLDIEVHADSVVIIIPAREADSQLDRLVTSSTTGLGMWESDQVLDDLYSGAPVRLTLPLNSWRQTLARLTRFHNYMRDPANHKHTGLSAKALANFDTSDLTFTVNEVAYKNHKEIPGPADLVVSLGTFELATGTLLVTDPCYEKGTWCTGELEARTGTWHAQTLLRDDSFGGHRNAMLTVVHQSVELDSVHPSDMEKTDVDVGVDSGQAGFFEKMRYPDEQAQLESDDGTWYSGVCDTTDNQDGTGPGAGIAPGGWGAVSQTFWGDGGYPCFVKRGEDGLVIAAVIVFDGSMSDDEDEEEGDGNNS